MTKLPENTKIPDEKVVLYVKMRKENKDWLEKTAVEQGFESTAKFVEALVESLKEQTAPSKKKSKAA